MNEDDERQSGAVPDQAAGEVVVLGNQLLALHGDDDRWDIASGLLAGAVQFWLYSRQPCEDPECGACSEINTAERRLRRLVEEVSEFAPDSLYFHSPNDANAAKG